MDNKCNTITISSWIRVNINTGAFWTAPIIKPFLTPEQMDTSSYYVWDEDAYQADNTTGWVLTSQ